MKRRWWLIGIHLLLAWIVAAGALTCVAAWQVAAKTLPFELREGLSYGPNERNDLDLFLPKVDGRGLCPAVLIIHGGGFYSGDKRQLRFLAELFAQNGYVAATLNYRLTPKWRYPAQLDDCQRAVRWLRKHADEFRIDPNRIGAAGASAGGMLALLLGTRETRDDSDPELKGISSKVQCVLCMSGGTDLTDERVRATNNPFLRQTFLWLFGKPYEEAPDLWKDASPLFHVSSDDAPAFLICGDQDPFVPLSQGERFAEAMKKAGVEVKMVVIKGMGHIPLTPQQREQFAQALKEALAFFDHHLKGDKGR